MLKEFITDFSAILVNCLRWSRQPLNGVSVQSKLRVTGYLRGAVSPFGLPRSMRILVDVRVMQEEDLSIGSGERNTTILISRTELLRALGNLEFGSFVD